MMRLSASLGSLAILLLTLVLAGETVVRPPKGVTATIAIEHQQRSTVGITIRNLRELGSVVVQNTSGASIAISVPESWERQEVTGTALRDVTAEEPALGFRRWHLPGDAGITFGTPKRIDHLEIYNPTGVPLQILLKRVDIVTAETEQESILLQQSPTAVF